MLVLKTIDFLKNFKDICAKVFSGEIVKLSRPKNQNVIILSETEYNSLTKAYRDLNFILKQ